MEQPCCGHAESEHRPMCEHVITHQYQDRRWCGCLFFYVPRPCDYCGHPELEHRPTCVMIVNLGVSGQVTYCGCLFYVPPERATEPEEYDAPGVPSRFESLDSPITRTARHDTWRLGRPWWRR